MILFNLILGCLGFMFAGSAFTRFKDTRNAQWVTTGIIEMLIGAYFVIAATGTA